MRAAALLVLVSACCTPRVVERPVIVAPPVCLTRPAPQAPPEVEVFGIEWTQYYVDLRAWADEVTESCGAHLLAEDGPAGHYGD